MKKNTVKFSSIIGINGQNSIQNMSDSDTGPYFTSKYTTDYKISGGQNKTISMIVSEYLFILALIPITIALLFFKTKLKGYEIIDFNKKNTFSLQSTVGFFLIFQVVDYFYEDGFIGMISQWFLYWIMGLIALLLMQTINYYKNYQLILKHS